MAKFWRVLFWPPTKFPEADWDEDPDVAAWLGTSRRVCEAYSAGLRHAGLTGRNSTLQFRTEASDQDLTADGVVRAAVNIDRFETFEFGHVQVPRGVARLSPDQRAELILLTVHRATRELARARGWDVAALDAAYEQALTGGCSFRSISDWKTSPGRTRRARTIFTLADDGFGRVVLEVGEPGGAVIATVGPALAFTTPEGFGRSMRTLRWTAKDAVELVPYAGSFGEKWGLLRWEAGGSGSPDPVAREAEPAEGEATIDLGDLSTRVVVRAEGDSVPGKPPEITAIGGGPTNSVPDAYLLSLHLLLGAMTSEPWQKWWGTSMEQALWIRYDFAPARAGCRIRRSGGRVSAWIDRPTGSIIAAPDPVQSAIDDVTALVAALRRRFTLEPAPPLPSYQALLDPQRDPAAPG